MPVTFHITFWTYVFQSGAPAWKHKHIFLNQFNSRNCIWHVMLKLDWDIFIKPLIKRSQHNRQKIVMSNTWIVFIYCPRCPIFLSKRYLTNFQIYWSAIIKNPIPWTSLYWTTMLSFCFQTSGHHGGCLLGPKSHPRVGFFGPQFFIIKKFRLRAI